MKKSIYFLMMFVGLAVTSCQPMDDIHDLVDAELDNKAIVGNVDYILSDADYETLELNYGNFSNLDDAKTLIPELLDGLFPVWGEGSIANVAFKLYAPKQDEKSLIVYEVTYDDYDMYGDDDFASFDRDWQITDLLEDKFADAANRTLVSLTYDYYNGGLQRDVNNGFLLLNGDWVMIPGLTEDEYAIMGESFPNFSSEDEAEAKLPIFLKDKFKFTNPQSGDIEPIMYKLYTTDVDDVDGDGKTDDRTTYSYVKYFVFDGMEWSVYDNTVMQSLQFGHDGNTWVPDNTIKYTLTDPDFELIGDALINTYPDPADSAGFYHNFDRRIGEDGYWSEEMILEAMNIFLDSLDPNAEVGQKYVITYDIYNGTNTTEDAKVIKEGAAWVYQ